MIPAMPDSSTTATTAAPHIRFYNTLSKQKETFQPLVPGKVGIYLCGPTVYKPAHIGHMVGPVIFDSLKRFLVYSGFEVQWVVNITDVDDKLIAQSHERNIPMSQVATEMTMDYMANLKAMGVDQIDQMPRATEFIDEIIKFISELIEGGYAYASAGDVLFDVARDEDYGKLSNRSAENQQGEGGEAASKKRSPGDFALWKAAKPGEPAWPSPWGEGRPGWHIECSAMSRRLLGQSFDIHGGGLDLVFPHHENELAQSESCHHAPFVKYWLHNGLMRAGTAAGKVGGRSDRDGASESATEEGAEEATVDTKISRSKGAGGLADLIARQGGERIRFFLLRTHYRSTIVFTEEEVAEAGVGLDTFHRFFERYQRVTGQSFYTLSPIARRDAGEIAASTDALLTFVAARRAGFLAKMDDDFNTGGAISELFDLVRELNKFVDQHQLEEQPGSKPELVTSFQRGVLTLRELSAILGLFKAPVAKTSAASDGLVEQLMRLMIELRADARGRKDFATADKVRQSLAEIGVLLEDRKGGTEWRVGP
ncbi:MAG: cysteine--tRNA ligase [Planctomycetota bacterium]